MQAERQERSSTRKWIYFVFAMMQKPEEGEEEEEEEEAAILAQAHADVASAEEKQSQKHRKTARIVQCIAVICEPRIRSGAS